MIFIRTYNQDDWDDICAVHDLARPEELKGSVPPEAFIPLEKAAENEGLFDGKLSVAELDNSLVGFVAWNPDEITWLYVHPEHQRNGIGRTLLLHALE